MSIPSIINQILKMKVFNVILIFINKLKLPLKNRILLIIARLVLHFKFTEKYPDEAPEMKIIESENIQDEDKIHEFVNSLVR